MRPRTVTTLGASGDWLVALGSSVYYVITSIGFLVTGTLLVVRRRAALGAAKSVWPHCIVYAAWPKSGTRERRTVLP